jgi:hypothetical protein
MKRLSARDIEHYYFEQFRAHTELPEGRIVYGDKPDVQIHGTPRIGVEIARLYITDGADPSSEQVQAAQRAKVLAQAQGIYRKRGGRAIEMHVDFNPACPILEIESVADQLAAYALAVESRPGRVHGGGRESDTPFRFVYHNGVVYPDARWRSTQVYTVPSLDTSRLEEVVSRKTLKAADYSLCEVYWLLLVVDFFDRAQDQELSLPPGYRLRNTAFERVVVYKPQFAQVLEVPQ